MKSLEKTYPIDIYGVKRIGIEKWLSNYYLPVGGDEFKKIEDDVLHAYMKGVAECKDKDVYWILVSNIKIPRLITVYIMYLLRLVRLKERGYKYVISSKKDNMPIDLSDFELTKVKGYHAIDSNVFHEKLWSRIKCLQRTIKYNLSVSSNINGSLFGNFLKPYFIIGSRKQDEVLSFCNEHGILPLVLIPTLFCGKNVDKVKFDLRLNELVDFSDKYVDAISRKYPVLCNIASTLKGRIGTNLIASSAYYFKVRGLFQRMQNKTLLATGLGNKLNKLFCAAWKSLGNEVVGFAHGNSYCNIYHRYCVINDGMPVVNRFIATSQGQEMLLNEVASDLSYNMEMPRIECLKSNEYHTLFLDLQKHHLVKRVKKVMINGIGFKSTYHMVYTGYHPFVKHELVLRLARVLKTAGFYVIYKARPDSVNEIEGLFDEYIDEILTERFEEVFHAADCIIFINSYTTTFGFALLTNRPIVLLNIKGAPWHPRAFGLLKKRCNIVEADYRDDRVVFDENELLDAIETSPDNIEYDILHEFAF